MRVELALPLLAVLLVACSSETTNLASSRAPEASPDAGPEDAGDPDAGDGEDASDAAPTVRVDEAGVVFCGAAPCACSNGRDDDGDGQIDGFDPECTGAFDQFEDSFATGVHGEDQDSKCQDCFFDDNSGAGNDGCSRPRGCALEDGDPSGSGACRSCAVSGACATNCQPLVPNGCDCFGCCGVWRAGVEIQVLLRSSCSLADLEDEDRCPRCVQAADCRNPCGECELCPGRRAADLPARCGDAAGPGFTCEDWSICLGSGDCGANRYCQQGCCMAIGILL